MVNTTFFSTDVSSEILSGVEKGVALPGITITSSPTFAPSNSKTPTVAGVRTILSGISLFMTNVTHNDTSTTVTVELIPTPHTLTNLVGAAHLPINITAQITVSSPTFDAFPTIERSGALLSQASRGVRVTQSRPTSSSLTQLPVAKMSSTIPPESLPGGEPLITLGHHIDIGWIIGGTVGGCLLAVVVIASAVFVLWTRKRRTRQHLATEGYLTSVIVDSYTSHRVNYLASRSKNLTIGSDDSAAHSHADQSAFRSPVCTGQEVINISTRLG